MTSLFELHHTAANLRALHVFGLWPREGAGKSAHVIYRTYHVITSTAFVLFTLSSLLAVLDVTGDIPDLLNTVFIIVANLNNFVKFLPFVVWRDRLANTLHTLRDLDEKVRLEADVQVYIVRACSRRIKVTLVLYFVFVYVTCLLWVTAPILDNVYGDVTNGTLTRRLPYVGWFPYDTSRSPLYEVTYAFHFYIFATATGIYVSTNHFYLSLVMIAGARLRVLATAILRLPLEVAEVTGHGSGERDVHHARERCLRECVIHHQLVLRYCNDVRQLLDPVLFADTLAVLLALCCCAFQLSTLPPHDPRFSLAIGMLSNILAEFLVVCLLCSNVSYESARVGHAIYQTDWYTWARPQRTAMAMVLLRAGRTVNMTASAMVVSLDTYVKVVKMSYSFYALLRQMHDEGTGHGP